MGKFFAALLSGVDSDVDTIHVCGLAAMVSLIVLTGYATYLSPMNYSPVAFSAALAAILGSIAGARRVRDGLPDGGSK